MAGPLEWGSTVPGVTLPSDTHTHTHTHTHTPFNEPTNKGMDGQEKERKTCRRIKHLGMSFSAHFEFKGLGQGKKKRMNANALAKMRVHIHSHISSNAFAFAKL